MTSPPFFLHVPAFLLDCVHAVQGGGGGGRNLSFQSGGRFCEIRSDF